MSRCRCWSLEDDCDCECHDIAGELYTISGKMLYRILYMNTTTVSKFFTFPFNQHVDRN